MATAAKKGRRKPRYEWWKTEAAAGERPQFRWHLKAANGEILSSGEGFSRKADVVRAINTHRNAAVTAEIVEVVVDDNG